MQKLTCTSERSRGMAQRKHRHAEDKSRLKTTADEGHLLHPHTKEHKIIGHAGCSCLARQVEDLVRQFHRLATTVGCLSVVPWSMLRLSKKVQTSGEGLLSEARWDVVRLHYYPSLEQVSCLASNFRDEARQAHEDRQREQDDDLEKLASHRLQSCL